MHNKGVISPVIRPRQSTNQLDLITTLNAVFKLTTIASES